MARCDSVADPKLAAPSVLYLPAELPVPASVQKLQRDCKVDVKHLPIVIRRPGEIDVTNLQPHGLLYLENSYVVPGGRFNEMYGWDSYFIIVGLLRDGRIDLARGMVENFFFEIARYGTLITWAELLGKTDVAEILKETLAEEEATDEALSQLGESGVNERAMQEAA